MICRSLFGSIQYGVFQNRGTSKWMVYMENPIKMDDLGVPPFKETSVSKSSLLLSLSNLEGVEGKARAAGLALLTQHCIFFTNSKSNMMHATFLNV